jgi:hypothetical protein
MHGKYVNTMILIYIFIGNENFIMDHFLNQILNNFILESYVITWITKQS